MSSAKMKKIALFGSDFSSLSQRAELDPFWVLNVKRLQNAFFFNSFPAVLRWCLLACAFLVVTFLLLPSFFGLFPAVWASCLLACAFLAVACLRCPVRLAFGRLWFLPAWLGVSGCTLPALSCLARFLPSLVCTCWVGCLWLLPACFVLSGSFPAVCGSYLLGWASLAVPCLRCPVWIVSCRLLFVPAWWGVLAVAYLFCPVRLVSGGLRFLPAWLDVSGCFFPAVSGLYLLACAFLAVARASSFPFSGSPLTVSASCLLGRFCLCAF